METNSTNNLQPLWEKQNLETPRLVGKKTGDQKGIMFAIYWETAVLLFEKHAGDLQKYICDSS